MSPRSRQTTHTVLDSTVGRALDCPGPCARRAGCVHPVAVRQIHRKAEAEALLPGWGAEPKFTVGADRGEDVFLEISLLCSGICM